MRHSSLILCALLGLVLSGCSDDDDHPRAKTATATAAVATRTATVTTPVATATLTARIEPTLTASAAATLTPSTAPTFTSSAAATATPTSTNTSPPTATATPSPTATNPVLVRTPDTIIAAGVPNGPAYVAVDSLGMVHIYASDLNAAVYVQGYETAKARFWQMDAFRRAAEGRLSELFGAITLRMDLQMRTVFTTRDGGRLEEELWQRLQAEEPQLAATAQAYADGINAWLADLRARRNGALLPPEYSLVNLTSDQLALWRPQDTLAIGRLQAYTLSETLEEELFFADVFASLPDALRQDVFRSAPAAPATVLPAPGSTIAPLARAADIQPPPQPARELLRSVRTALQENSRFNPLGAADAGLGSNNWIIAPQLSASGFAMLANDPHLPLFNPGIWHMVQLDSGGHTRATGVNFPGLPGIILGHNDFGAWGGTVANFDVTDIYMEQVTTPPDYPNSPRTVLFNGQQVPVLRVVEDFALPTGTVSAVIEVVPHHGPMVPDPNPNDDVVGLAATNMSFRWTGHEITLDARFLTDLNQARNVEEFKAAVRYFAAGAQNWVWADTSGDIAYFPYVLVPQRPPGTIPYLPLDGTGSAEWLHDEQGNTLWLPEDKFPQAFNPPQGYLSTANNDQLGNTLDNDPLNDETYFTFTADIGFREQRIHDLLSNRAGVRPEGAKITLADMSAYQYDTVSLEASRLVPFLFAAAEARPDLVTPEMQDAIDRLRDWGTEKPESHAWITPSGVDAADERDDFPVREVAISQEERDDAVATAIYAGWTTRLSQAVFNDDFAGTGIGVPGGEEATKGLLHILEDIDRTDPGFVVHTKGAHGESTLWDNKTTPEVETRDEMLLQALADDLVFLADLFASNAPQDWLWGKLHRAAFQHFFGTAGIQNFNIGNIPAPGCRFCVNVAEWSLNANSAGDFVFFDNAPSERFVAVLDPAGVRSVNILPGGNNGNPCAGPAPPPNCMLDTPSYNHINPANHYGEHIPGWINGQVFDVRVSREAVAADTETLTEYTAARP
jgi:penicillin amidase